MSDTDRRTPLREPPEEVIVTQAVDWVVRQSGGQTLSAAEQVALDAWLRRSDAHLHAYLEFSALAHHLSHAMREHGLGTEEPSAATKRTTQVTALRQADDPPGRRTRRSRTLLAVAAALVLAATARWLASVAPWDSPQEIVAPPGEPRVSALADGSTLFLHGGARITVRYSRTARRIDLVQGQALFKVQQDPARPFVVRAGSTDVVAVGTQFDVARDRNATTVTVLQGRVDVVSHAASRADRAPVLLDAGQQIEVLPTQGFHVLRVDVRAATAWAHREIALDGRPLGEVLEEVNRYAPVPITVEDAALRTLRLSGTLDAYDTTSLLLVLGEYGEIEVSSHAIRVRSRAVSRDAAPANVSP